MNIARWIYGIFGSVGNAYRLIGRFTVGFEKDQQLLELTTPLFMQDGDLVHIQQPFKYLLTTFKLRRIPCTSESSTDRPSVLNRIAVPV